VVLKGIEDHPLFGDESMAGGQNHLKEICSELDRYAILYEVENGGNHTLLSYTLPNGTRRKRPVHIGDKHGVLAYRRSMADIRREIGAIASLSEAASGTVFVRLSPVLAKAIGIKAGDRVDVIRKNEYLYVTPNMEGKYKIQEPHPKSLHVNIGYSVLGLAKKKINITRIDTKLMESGIKLGPIPKTFFPEETKTADIAVLHPKTETTKPKPVEPESTVSKTENKDQKVRAAIAMLNELIRNGEFRIEFNTDNKLAAWRRI